MTPNSELLINGAAGVYIGQWFAEQYLQYVTNKDEFTDEITDLLQGPDAEFYWDSWQSITDGAELVNDRGEKCILFQCDDLWAVPVSEIDQIPEIC